MLKNLLLALLPSAKDALNRVLSVYKAQLIANIDREVGKVIIEIDDPKSPTLSPDAIKMRVAKAIEISGIPAYVKLPLQVIVFSFDLKHYTGNLVVAVQAETERIKRAINGARL